MKRKFNITNCITCFFIASLSFVFTSCDKDDWSLIYFRCELNGEQYKTPNPTFSFESKNEPVLTITASESTTTYHFYTTIYPKDERSDKPIYVLALKIHLKEPLKIGETYFISKLEEPYPVWTIDTKPTPKDYVYLSMYGNNNESYGSGNFKLVEYNKEEQWYKGTVEFEFDSLVKEEGGSEKIILKGEFCATDY
jgi:hypothetical protein